MFAHLECNSRSPGVARGEHTRHPRHDWVVRCWRRHGSIQDHREVPGCGRRLTPHQYKAEDAIRSHVPAPSASQHPQPTSRASTQCTALRDVPSNAEASLRHRVVPCRTPSPAATSLASSKTISSSQPASRLKLAVPSPTAAHPEIDGDKDETPDAGQSDEDEDLWDELGEEVPAEWDDDKPTRKRTGKPVPPGPKKAKPSPEDPPASSDQQRQQDTETSASSANISSTNLEPQPPAAARQWDQQGAVEEPHKQSLPAAKADGQQRQAGSLSAAATTQLGTATVPSVESERRTSDSSLDGSSHVTDTRSSSTQETGRKPASSSASPGSKAERLKKRVLTGSKEAASLQGSAAPGGRGSRTWHAGSRPQLRLSPDFEERGQKPGYYTDLLVAAGFLTPQLEKHPETSAHALGLQINRCLMATKSWHGILNIGRDLSHVFDSVNVSSAIHRIAKLIKYSRTPSHMVLTHPLYPLLINAAIKVVPAFEARQMANILWGLATLRDRSSPLLLHLDRRILELELSSYIQQELSNVMWAYGTMQYQGNPDFMQRAAQEMLRRGIGQFMPQAISNACWAFAKLDLIYDDFLEAVGAHAAEQLHTWNSQAIANLVWAYAKMEVCHDPLMAAVAATVTAQVYSRPDAPSHSKIEEFTCQEVSNVMLAFARLSIYSAEVLQLVETEMSKPHRLKASTQQGLVNVMWAFATLRFYPAKYFSAVSPYLAKSLPAFRDQELASCLWSFGRMAHHPGKLMTTLCEAVDCQVRTNPHFSLQATTNSLWAMAVLGSAHNSTAMRLVQYLYSHEHAYLLDTHLHQTFQAVLLARVQAIMAGDKELANRLVMPARMQAQAVKCWKTMMRISRVSVFQQDVSDVVAALQIEHQMEYLAQDGLFSVDVAILSEGKSIAIEVDGPFHYTLNTHQPLGHTLLRRRLLTAMGWTVVSVPYFDWNRLQSGLDKAHYMARLLIQQGYELPDSNLFQNASSIQDRGTAWVPVGPAAHAATSHSVPGSLGEQKAPAAAPPPSYSWSQDNSEMP